MTEQGGDGIFQPERNPPRTRGAIGEVRSEKTHGVGAAWISDGFDVRVFVDIDARANGYALGQIVTATRHARPDQGFGVGAHVFAQLHADSGERASLSEMK